MGRPAWPKPHVTGHPKSHGPCQEQRAGAKHLVIGENKASSAGGPASIPLPVQCLQPRGTANLLPKLQPSPGRVLPARDSSQEKNHPKGEQHSSRQTFPYQHTRTGVKQQHQSYRGRAWQLQDPCRAIPLLEYLSIPNTNTCRICFLPFQQEQGVSDPLPSCWSLPSLLLAFSTGRGSIHQHGFSHSRALLTTRASQCLRTSSMKSHFPRTITCPSPEHCRRERGKMLDMTAAMRERFW